MTISGRDWTELTPLLGGLAVVLLLLAFATLTGEVREGDTRHFDERVLISLRQADDPRVPIGPRWLQYAALDITALGGPTVLGLVVLAIVGFLVLQGAGRTALFVLIASTGGWLLNAGLKAWFQRPRPEVVPHLRDVMESSFPSGHAMTSAAVYLTLGALLMRVAERRVTKLYCIAVAMMATVLVGVSRVYLGVHYPSDVLAGWLAGLSWAVICWLVERAIERRTGMKSEMDQVSRG